MSGPEIRFGLTLRHLSEPSLIFVAPSDLQGRTSAAPSRVTTSVQRGGLLGALAAVHPREREHVVRRARVHADGVAGLEVALEHLDGQRIQQQPLQRALQRPRAVYRI